MVWSVALESLWPLVQSICEAGDAGRPAVMQESTPQALAFMEMASKIAQQVSIVNSQRQLVTSN